MNQAIKRSIVRWIHIICCVPLLGYTYGEPSEVQQYAGAVRNIFIPVIVLTGLWMWKGHLLRRLISKRPAGALE